MIESNILDLGSQKRGLIRKFRKFVQETTARKRHVYSKYEEQLK